MKSNATKLIQISTDKTTPLCRAKTTAAEIASRFVSVRSLVRFSYVPTHTSRARNGAYVGRKEGRKGGPLLPPSLHLALPLYPEAVLAGGVRIGDVLCRMDAAKNKASIGGRDSHFVIINWVREFSLRSWK